MNTLSNEEHFLEVIEQHKGIIYKVANSFKKEEDDKKDLVQEIIFQLWRTFSSYNGESKVSTWMYRVALNVAIASYRKEKRKNELITPFTESIIEFSGDEEPNDNIRLLQQFINELNELDRALMILYLEEKSGKEMAEILGLSESNIRTKINRVKDKLKQKFSQVNK